MTGAPELCAIAPYRQRCPFIGLKLYSGGICPSLRNYLSPPGAARHLHDNTGGYLIPITVFRLILQ